MNKIILASASPRRKELLSQIGIPFDIVISDAQEITKSSLPEEMVEELSWLKAEDVREKLSEEERKKRVILGADTIVSCEGKVLLKPKDRQQAFEMLSLLQGREHEVYTGVTLLTADSKRHITFHEKTIVHVYPMSEKEILNYIETGSPMDKAGAYGIQGEFAAFIRKIEGDYYNVVGLPVGRVYQELKKIRYGIDSIVALQHNRRKVPA